MYMYTYNFPILILGSAFSTTKTNSSRNRMNEVDDGIFRILLSFYPSNQTTERQSQLHVNVTTYYVAKPKLHHNNIRKAVMEGNQAKPQFTSFWYSG